MIGSDLEKSLNGLKRAARELRRLTSAEKDAILGLVADRIIKKKEEILQANRRDLARLATRAPPTGTKPSPAFRDRLTLNSTRVDQMAESIRAVARLPDPVGEVIESRTLKNGLKIRRVRAPLGTILMIFESRPNVITEVFALAFKSGNTIALRGGSDSRETAAYLYQIIQFILMSKMPDRSRSAMTLPFVGIEDYDRDLVGRLLQRKDLFDICIPRGGSELIDRVTSEAAMPVIKNDKGICHLYAHEAADIDMVVNIAINAKTQRPGVCNAMETLLVDRSIARDVFKKLMPEMFSKGVQFAVCDDSFEILQSIAKTDLVETKWMSAVSHANEKDFATEYLDLKMNVKVVDGVELAIYHISRFGSDHSETIVTQDETIARQFQAEVDSACVYWNASTRFTDGFELGLGGEIGISTQKLHVRGPVGLRELTSARWLMDGTGQVRE